jgi:hypothetical protein
MYMFFYVLYNYIWSYTVFYIMSWGNFIHSILGNLQAYVAFI